MTAVVLAGGQSRRMNTNKAFVDIGGKPMIERVLSVIRPLFSEILINSNMPEAYTALGYPVIQDIFPGKGALGGIYSGLVHARTEYVFCVACDMPALNRDLIQYMQQQIHGWDVLAPRAPDGLHPLHAMYSKRSQPVIKELLGENVLKISALFSLVQCHYISEQQIRQFDPDFESFLNINTLEDLAEIKDRLEGKNDFPP